MLPNGETTPIPDTATAVDTARTLPYPKMKSCRRRIGTQITIAVIVIACTASFAAQNPPIDQSFESIYKRSLELNSTLKTLTARFTETTTSTMLTRPLVATGTIAVERPSRIVLHYQEPELRDVLIDGDRLTLSWPARQIREVTNIATINRRIQRYFVESSSQQLRDSFTIAIRTEDARPHMLELSMVPKRKQIREGLASLDLWIDDRSLMLTAMKMTFPNGDTKLMALEGVVANAPVEPSVFTAAK